MTVVVVSISLVEAAVDVLTVVLPTSWTVVPRVVTALVSTVVVAVKKVILILIKVAHGFDTLIKLYTA